MNDEFDFVETATAKVIVTGDSCSLVLENWNIDHELNGYTTDEVKQLIEMLNQSLDIMNKYNEAQKSLPLFEKVGGFAHVQQENQQPFGSVD